MRVWGFQYCGQKTKAHSARSSAHSVHEKTNHSRIGKGCLDCASALGADDCVLFPVRILLDNIPAPIAEQEALLQQSVLSYEESVLRAVMEVENGLGELYLDRV